MAKQSKKPDVPTQHRFISAKTGQYVSEQFANKHKATTIKQTIHPKKGR